MSEGRDVKVGDLCVWWIPQVPGQPFSWRVSSIKEATNLLTMLACYDQFQLEQNIKPDYSNTGGLWVWSDDIDGEGTAGWEDWWDEETGTDDPFEWLDEQERPVGR